MTTKRLVIDMIAATVTIFFLLVFIPFALNATDTLTNVAGVAVIAGLVIALIAAVHHKFTHKDG